MAAPAYLYVQKTVRAHSSDTLYQWRLYWTPRHSEISIVEDSVEGLAISAPLCLFSNLAQEIVDTGSDPASQQPSLSSTHQINAKTSAADFKRLLFASIGA